MSKRKEAVILPILHVTADLAGIAYPLAFTFGSFTLTERELSKRGIAFDWRTGDGLAALDDIRPETLGPLLHGAMHGGGATTPLAEVEELVANLPMYAVMDLYRKVSEAMIASLTPPGTQAKNAAADAE